MIKKLFLGLKNYKKFRKKLDNNDIIFFSEGDHHWAHLKFLIPHCLKKFNVKYITLSSQDKGLNLSSKNFDSFFINNTFLLHLLFRNLNSNYVITSLPDLGKLYFKNFNNNKFIYVFHSLASTHLQYNSDAFDNFDIVLCAGPHHYREIRKAEKINKTNKKILYNYGYPRLEEIYNISNSGKFLNKNKTILIASSWGKNSITNLCIDKILENLINSNYKIIYRPHSMSLIKNNGIIKNILKKFRKYKNFSIDKSNSTIENILKADLMIADWGSTSADYIITTKKPVIFIDTPAKIKNKSYKKIDESAFELEIRKDIGHVYKIEDIDNLLSIIANIINFRLSDREVKKFINKNIYNYLSSHDNWKRIFNLITNEKTSLK